jgi:hypothetical protein
MGAGIAFQHARKALAHAACSLWPMRRLRGTQVLRHIFHKLARAIRIMVSMQIVPADVARLLRPKKPRPVDVGFYAGRNAIRTPHDYSMQCAFLTRLASTTK